MMYILPSCNLRTMFLYLLTLEIASISGQLQANWPWDSYAAKVEGLEEGEREVNSLKLRSNITVFCGLCGLNIHF